MPSLSPQYLWMLIQNFSLPTGFSAGGGVKVQLRRSRWRRTERVKGRRPLIARGVRMWSRRIKSFWSLYVDDICLPRPSWLKQWLDKPDGSPATIKFIEVGGRTTALVEELQKMPDGIEIKPKISKGGKWAGAKRKKAIKEEESVSSSDHDHMTKC